MVFKIGVLKNFARRGFNTSLFLLNLGIFKSTFFYRTPPVAASTDDVKSMLEIRKWLIFFQVLTLQKKMKFSIKDFLS